MEVKDPEASQGEAVESCSFSSSSQGEEGRPVQGEKGAVSWSESGFRVSCSLIEKDEPRYLMKLIGFKGHRPVRGFWISGLTVQRAC